MSVERPTGSRAKCSLRGLRPYWRRMDHITINVSDLERACGFWEPTLGLKRCAHTGTPRQQFAGLGVEHGAFDGWMLWNPTDRVTSCGTSASAHLGGEISPAMTQQQHPTSW